MFVSRLGDLAATQSDLIVTVVGQTDGSLDHGEDLLGSEENLLQRTSTAAAFSAETLCRSWGLSIVPCKMTTVSIDRTFLRRTSQWRTLTQKYETLVFSLFSNPSNMRSGSFLLRKTTYRWNISTWTWDDFLLTSVLVSSLAGWKKSLRNPLTLSKLIFPQTMMNCRWGLTWNILVFLIPISTVHHSVHIISSN